MFIFIYFGAMNICTVLKCVKWIHNEVIVVLMHECYIENMYVNIRFMK